MGDGCFCKRIFFCIFIITIIIIGSTPVVNAGIKLLPAELKIDISSYPEDKIEYESICVENPYNHEILVKTEIKNPTESSITEGYSNIPDLSWLNVEPEERIIPAKSKSFFTLEVNIPEDEKKFHYGEKWEVLACVYEKSNSTKGSVTINMKLATKVFIHTPVKASEEKTSNDYFMFAMFISLVFFVLFMILIIRKNSTSKRSSIYYLRKKQDKEDE